MASAGERTEKATSRRRKQARDKGQFAYSQELTSAMVLAVCDIAVGPQWPLTFLVGRLTPVLCAIDCSCVRVGSGSAPV